ASGDVALGAGVGANVLIGGAQPRIELQPVLIEGSVALDVTLGLSALQFRGLPWTWEKVAPRHRPPRDGASRDLGGSGGEDRRVQRPSSTHPPLIRCVHVTAFGRCAVALMGGSPEPGFGCCALLSSAISLDCMRHDDKAGAKKSERDRYVKHGT